MNNRTPSVNTHGGWQIFDATAPLLTYEYSFGQGGATAIAVGAGDGLVIVSPPRGVGEEVFRELERFGPVRGLVAPNAFHHLGLSHWLARFPSAPVFAPAAAIKPLRKKTGLTSVLPLSAARALCGDRLELIDLPYCKTGETLVRVDSERGLVWFLADVLTNMPALPAHPIAKWLFRLSGSAPGLRFNNLAAILMVDNKREIKRWLLERLDADRPDWLIPGHGNPVDLRAGRDLLRRALRTPDPFPFHSIHG